MVAAGTARTPRVALGAALGAALLIAGAVPRVASARPAALHPLHTSFAAVAYDPAARALTVSLRVFTDDFSADVIRRTGVRGGADGVPPDAAVFRYVVARFTVVGARGAALVFQGCGVRRVGVQLFICLRAPAAGPPAGARVRSAILSDVFTDQINIVQSSVGGRRQTLLFTPGDGPKAL